MSAHSHHRSARRTDRIAVISGGVGAARFLRGSDRRRRPEPDHRGGQHRRRHGAPRAVDLARPRHHHLHARRGDRSRTRAGGSSTRPGGRWRRSTGTPQSDPPGRRPHRSGSTSATRTSPRTSIAPLGSPRGRRSPRSPTRSVSAWNVPGAPGPDVGSAAVDDRLGRPRTPMPAGAARDVSFQDYFVRLRHSVPVAAVRFDGDAQLAPAAASRPRRCGVHRDRTVESARVDRPAPLARRGRRHCSPPDAIGVVAVSPIVGGAGAQGPGRPDAARARSRTERGRRRPDVRRRSPPCS